MDGDTLLHSLHEKKEKFDLVFIDADKAAYRKYVLTILGISTKEDDNCDDKKLEIDMDKCLLNDGTFLCLTSTLSHIRHSLYDIHLRIV